MIKWAITLGEFDISYQPKPVEKGQAVVDFIADFTYHVDIVSTAKKVVSLPSEAQKIEPITQHGVYMLMAHPTNRVVKQD
ncbi:hypothetical protein COP2_023281 [Malus domestica]